MTEEGPILAKANRDSGVTFIGTGAIGLPMALRLLQAEFDVTCVEPGETQLERASSSGLSCVTDLGAAPRNPIAIVMVATPDQLAQVVDSAVSDHQQLDGQLWIIMSTVGPQSIGIQSQRLQFSGAQVVDAPVTGGVRGAEAGSLSIFCSGNASAVTAAQSVLSHMGSPEMVGDEPGLGQVVKVINQHLCSVHLVAAAEALSLAQDFGLDPAHVLELVGKGAAASWMLNDRGQRMLQSSPEITSSVGIFVKDSALVAQAAADAGSETPVLNAARTQFLKASSLGLMTEDDSAVFKTYR